MAKYKIIPTHGFTKDVRQAAKEKKDIQKLTETISRLAEGKPLDAKYKDHALHGFTDGRRECHIQPDWLLVYRIDKGILTLFLIATGSHSDLF
jgi:mRNA interferase YafQ